MDDERHREGWRFDEMRRGLIGSGYAHFMREHAANARGPIPSVSPVSVVRAKNLPMESAFRGGGRARDVVATGSAADPSNSVLRWAKSEVGKGHYDWEDRAAEARGRLQNHLGPRRGFGAPKCNIFVWDALTAGGVAPSRFKDGHIPRAKEWGDSQVQIGGYDVVTGPPQPGDVISNGHHVGLYAPLPSGRPGTISAATPGRAGGWNGEVIHNDWGFRGDEGAITIRRPKSKRK